MDSSESAMNCLDTVLELDPENEKARFRKAEAFFLQKELKSAEDCLTSLIRSFPSNKSARSKLKEVRNLLKIQQQKEEFDELNRKATERKRIAEEKLNDWRLSEEDLVSICPKNSTLNGAVEVDEENGISFIWNQSLLKLNLFISLRDLPKSFKSSDLVVKCNRKSLQITYKELKIIREFHRPTLPEDAVWQLERIRESNLAVISIELFKDNSNFEGDRQEWWPQLFKSSKMLDISTLTLPDEMLHELSDETQREWKKNFVQGVETGEIKSRMAEEEEAAKLKSEAENEVATRKNNNEKARKDPNKKALLEMLEKNFPDLPVEIR